MTEEQVRKIIREELKDLLGIDRYTFQKNIQIFDNRHIQVGRATGTKIGTATDQKVGFYGVPPVVQAGAISAPAGGGSSSLDAVDQTARTAINAIRTALTNIGITA